jgi:histidyl-tRNA synthetase
MRAPIYVIIHYLQHAERLSASRLVLVGADEWARGTVSVKNLAAREQKEMSVAELLSNQEIGLKSEGKPSS